MVCAAFKVKQFAIALALLAGTHANGGISGRGRLPCRVGRRPAHHRHGSEKKKSVIAKAILGVGVVVADPLSGTPGQSEFIFAAPETKMISSDSFALTRKAHLAIMVVFFRCHAKQGQFLRG